MASLSLSIANFAEKRITYLKLEMRKRQSFIRQMAVSALLFVVSAMAGAPGS